MKRVVLVLLALILIATSTTNRTPTVAGVSKALKLAGIGVLGALGSALTHGYLDVVGAIAIFGGIASNDITATAYSHDDNYAVRVSPPPLTLGRAVTDSPEFPESVNELFNIAVNKELYLASMCMALATATNRHYTALYYHDDASAQMQVEDIQTFLGEADQVEDIAALRFEELAAELQNTGSDRVVDETTFINYQADLSTVGFSEDTLDIFGMLIPNIDPILLAKVDPIEEGKTWFLSYQYDDIPHSLSQGALESATNLRDLSSVIGPFPGPIPDGGIAIPVDKLGLLAPYIALAVAVVAITVGTLYARKRWLGKATVQKP